MEQFDYRTIRTDIIKRSNKINLANRYRYYRTVMLDVKFIIIWDKLQIIYQFILRYDTWK